jgi:hypothetical protein
LGGETEQPPRAAAHVLLPIIAMSTFAGALSVRAMDPVLPQVAADLAVTIQVSFSSA